jgi:hypothetical protein
MDIQELLRKRKEEGGKESLNLVIVGGLRLLIDVNFC